MAKNEMRGSDFVAKAKEDGLPINLTQLGNAARRGTIKRRKKGTKVLFVYDKKAIEKYLAGSARYNKNKDTKATKSTTGRRPGPKPGPRPGRRPGPKKTPTRFEAVQAVLQEAKAYSLDPADYMELLERAKGKALV